MMIRKSPNEGFDKINKDSIKRDKRELKQIKLMDVDKRKKRLYSFGFGVSSVALLALLATFATAFAGQKGLKSDQTAQTDASKVIYSLKVAEGSGFTQEDNPWELAAVPTEAATEETKAPVEIIPIEQLNIVNEDLSYEESHEEIQGVEVTPEEVVVAPTNEIAKLVHGIDVSSYQGNIDWSRVKADGIDFAIIRMGGRSTRSGALFFDDYFEKNIQGALANGIQVGVYLFSQAVNEQEAYEEASFLLGYISKYKITYPVVFDWESADGYRVSSAGISPDALTAIATRFCDTVASYGYTPMVYFNRNDWYNAVNGDQLTSKYKSWLAVYWNDYILYRINSKNRYDASTQELPSFRYSYQMWQYTSSGVVDGINGRVDMDIAFFYYANYKVDKSPIELNVKNMNITINTGDTPKLMEGVSAKNSIGYDATSEVRLKIINYENADVSDDLTWVSEHPGKYTLYYKFKDPTGESKEVIAVLNVRSAPTLSLKSDSLSYTYNSTLTYAKNLEAINKIIADNATAKSYEGKEIVVKVNDLDKTLGVAFEAGKYVLKCTADDGAGLTTDANLTLTVINGGQQTTTQNQTSAQNRTAN